MTEASKKARDKAKELLNAVNAEYSDETFVSDGYGYYDDMIKILLAMYDQGLEDAAQIVEEQERRFYAAVAQQGSNVLRGSYALDIRAAKTGAK